MQNTRRSFFKKLFSESISTFEELRGIPQFRLDKIQELPDRIIKDIIPVAAPQNAYNIEGNKLVKRIAGEDPPVIVRTFDPEEVCIINLFNGQNQLRSVAKEIANRQPVPDIEQSFQKVKSIFAELSRLMIYIPSGSHERKDEDSMELG